MSAFEQLVERQQAAVEQGLCKCLCGERRKAASEYANYERHRQRAYEARVRARALDDGVPVKLRLNPVSHPKGRTSDAQNGRKTARKRRPSDIRIPLPRLQQAVEELLGAEQPLGRRLLDAVLTERQRQTLEGR